MQGCVMLRDFEGRQLAGATETIAMPERWNKFMGILGRLQESK
jgi:hypothetical protein